MTPVTCKHFGFTVTDDNNTDNRNGFNFREEFTVEGYHITETVTVIDITDKINNITIHMTFSDDQVGITRDVKFCDNSVRVQFESIEEDKTLEDCIQLGGRKFHFDVD